ncbi:unnamed protein product, partial [Gulo gulo]
AAHLRAKDPEPSFPLKPFPSSAGRQPLRTGRPHPVLQRPASPPARGPFLHFLCGVLIHGTFCFLLFPLCCSKTIQAQTPDSGESSTSPERRLPRTTPAPPADPKAGAPTPPALPAACLRSPEEASREFIDAPIPVV